MKVICKKNDAKGLELKEVGLTLDEYYYGLTIGKEFLIMGVQLNKTTSSPKYLVDEEKWGPIWYPYILFDMIDMQIPPNWLIDVYDNKSPGDLRSLMGFKELVTNDDLHDALIDGQQWALDIYFKRKAEVEKYYQENAELKGNYESYL